MVNKQSNRENRIVAFAAVMVGILIISLKYTYYYDLIDDVLMKDILSGEYTGIPETRNMQMLWPLAAFISLLYRITDSISWFGWMLVIFQYGSVFLFVYKGLTLTDAKRIDDFKKRILVKLGTSFLMVFLLFGIMLTNLVNVQYTITVAFMASAAIMWILTAPKCEDWKSFLKANIPAVIILFLAFMLRTEMLLLMLPYVGLAGLYKWSFEKKFFHKDNIKKYLILAGTILLSLGIAKGADTVAYSGDEWSSFVDLFDARTTLYDFNQIPEYAGNEEFYSSIDINEAEQKLFENYNYAINDKVDANLIARVADYAEDIKHAEASGSSKLKEAAKTLMYEMSHGRNSEGSDYPWNLVVGFLYIFVIMQLIFAHDIWGLWRPAILFLGRCSIWIYILMGGRSPERITNSLFYIEICLLIALATGLVMRNSNKVQNERAGLKENEEDDVENLSNRHKNVQWVKVTATSVAAIAGIAFASIFLYEKAPKLAKSQSERADIVRQYDEMTKNLMKDSEGYYLMDVYSVVSYLEPIFGEYSYKNKENGDLLGGWIALSPCTDEKLSNNKLTNIKDGMLQDNVYLIQRRGRDTDWIVNFYSGRNVSIEVEELDEFYVSQDHKECEDDFILYKING